MRKFKLTFCSVIILVLLSSSCSKKNKVTDDAFIHNTKNVFNPVLERELKRYFEHIDQREKEKKIVYTLTFDEFDSSCYITFSYFRTGYGSLVFKKYTYLDNRLIVFIDSTNPKLHEELLPVRQVSLNTKCINGFVDTMNLITFNGHIDGYKERDYVVSDPAYLIFEIISIDSIKRVPNPYLKYAPKPENSEEDE